MNCANAFIVFSHSVSSTLILGVLFYLIYPTKCHTRCLQLALECRAEVNNVSAQGTHVFQIMCERAHDCTHLCLIMLNAGTDPNATNQVVG